MSKQEILEKLRQALLNYDADAAESAAREVIEKNVSPLDGINVLTSTAKEIGDRYGRSEIFLSDLMIAADALVTGVSIIMTKIPRDQIARKGTVVIGTVKGDIHDIGKNIVGSMLTASGFEVHDLGKDVATPTFADMAENSRADIVAVSALMSTSLPMQRDIIDYFKAMGIRAKYKIMVGGGPVTREYAEQIGANGYAPDAAEAAKLALELK